jgi:hypothetical protein
MEKGLREATASPKGAGGCARRTAERRRHWMALARGQTALGRVGVRVFGGLLTPLPGTAVRPPLPPGWFRLVPWWLCLSGRLCLADGQDCQVGLSLAVDEAGLDSSVRMGRMRRGGGTRSRLRSGAPATMPKTQEARVQVVR